MSNKKKTINSAKPTQKKGLASKVDSQLAASGELHQFAGQEHPALTTNQGVALSDNQNSLKANLHGPTLLEDFILREKLRILITSVFPSASFTRGHQASMVSKTSTAYEKVCLRLESIWTQ